MFFLYFRHFQKFTKCGLIYKSKEKLKMKALRRKESTMTIPGYKVSENNEKRKKYV